MDSARWDLAQDLFASALPLPRADRDRLLRASGADADTIDVVQEMLQADDNGGSLLDRSVQHLASELLMNSDSIKTTPSMQEFGAYRLLRLLGEGGMGVVWLAARTDTQAQVAVKFLPGAWLSPARCVRFMQEVRLLAKLRHASIACLYDAGTLPDGTPWFAMEYVDGQSFAAYSSNLNSLKDLLQLFCAVCEAVQHAHGKGIIHRDLKPSNLLVESNGTPKLLDFGIASELDRASSPSGLTALGLRFASPPYSAPEYVHDGTATAMSDVYSLGVMLYECLTGDSLTASKGVTSNANAMIAECRPSLAARGSLNNHSMDRAAFTTSWQGALAKITRSEWNDLDVLCLKATHHDPARRYPSVEALARDVQHFLRQEPLEARPDTWTYRSAKFLRRNTFAVVSAIATLCVLLAMATVFTVRLARARTEALAQAERATRVQQFMLGLFANSGKPTDAPGNLTVETLLDRGAVEVETLHQNPALQADLNRMLGDMYSDLGKPAKAETGYVQALTFAESQPGTSIASLVDLRLQLAKVFTHENKIPQAHELIARTIQLIAQRAPNNLALRAKADSRWGSIIKLEGNYSAAEPILKAVAAEQELYATSKSDRMSTLINLSGTQIFLGHYKDSDATNERLVALCKDEPGDTPQLGDALQNLGESAEVQGRYDQAEQYERKSIRLASSWYGIDHRITANKMSSLAATLIDEKKDDEAATVLRKVMAIEERTYPPDSVYRAKTLKSVGMLQLATGHSEAALISFDRVLAIMRSHYSDDSYLIARTYIFQGMVYQQMRDDAHAEELFRKGLQMLQRVRGETDVYTALARLKLGHTLLTQNRYNEAETQLHAACATYKALSMEQTNLMQEARKDLVAVEDARHNS